MDIGIVGLGLIGGSFAKALQKDRSLNIYAADLITDNVRRAITYGEIKGELTDERIKDCDYIIIALYPEDTMRYIHDNAALFRKDAVVMDCCGIKVSICEAVRPVSEEYGFTFVGGDPFAGMNGSGYESSKATLFKNAPMILTPYADTPASVIEDLSRLLRRAGFASIMQMSPEEHDRIIALTSQLTHIISNALVKSPAASESNSFFSGSYRDLTRRAALNEQMWSEVFVGNKKYLTEEIDTFIRNLQEYRSLIETGNVADLQEIIREGSQKKTDVMQNNVITVAASRSYDVIIRPGVIRETGSYVKNILSPDTAVVVSDDSVFSYYGDTVISSLEKEGIKALSFVFPHGEASKQKDVLFRLQEYMADNSVTRSDMVVALGGGVVGDMAGFAASIYLRGIPFIQIPTSLLAAVDSSVGGKTAIDLDAGKNLTGVFSQPYLVLCDTDTLSTLPPEEFSAGMAEVIKYGVLCDEDLFSLLETEDAHDYIDSIIRRCVSIKREVVMADEFDTGSRQVLNLGHTIGHAVEQLSNFTISHGFAVAIGMMAIARCAWAAGLADEDITPRLGRVLERYGLPTECPYSVDDLCQVMLKDKKRNGQSITLAIPRKIGDTYLYKMDISDLKKFFSAI